MFRQQLARQVRLFSTTPIARKSPVETVKDAAKVVDRTVSDIAVKGIEKGAKNMTDMFQTYEQAAAAVKEAAPETKGEAKGQANEVAGQAKGKANELAGEAKGKAHELKGEANAKL
ncbi:Nn.00g048810.m01.CDS01 [Neocucurbitaria sp. VM-36]